MARVLWVFSLVLVSMVASADYRVELGYETSNIESSSSSDSYQYESDTQTSNSVIYFSPVSTADVPIAEAGFLAKQTHVGLAFASQESEETSSSFFNESFNSESDFRAIGINFFIPGTDFFLSGTLVQGEGQDSDLGSFESDEVSLGFGWYLTENSALAFGYSAEDSTYGYSFFYGESKSKTTALSVEYKHIVSLYPGSFLGIYGALDLIETDSAGSGLDSDAAQFVVGVDWYPNTRFSIGYRIDSTSTSGYYSDYTTVYSTINTSYFFNEAFGIYASLGSGETYYDDYDDYEYDEDLFSIGLRVNI